MANFTIAARKELGSHTLDSLHAFRHEVFVGRLRWELPLIDGVERDQYDRDDAVYVTATDDDEGVTGFARLLPTVGSYMLPELFPELLGTLPPPRHPAVWELSRFAAGVHERCGKVMALSRATLDLLATVMRFAAGRGIERLILVTTIGIERLMLRAGLDVHRMAPPAQSHGEWHVALCIEVSHLASQQPGAAVHARTA
jgi:acyl homoserine lactone synthase